MPSPVDVEGFIELYQKLYGITLPEDEAFDLIGRLMRFYYLTRLKPHLAKTADLSKFLVR